MTSDNPDPRPDVPHTAGRWGTNRKPQLSETGPRPSTQDPQLQSPCFELYSAESPMGENLKVYMRSGGFVGTYYHHHYVVRCPDNKVIEIPTFQGQLTIRGRRLSALAELLHERRVKAIRVVSDSEAREHKDVPIITAIEFKAAGESVDPQAES